MIVAVAANVRGTTPLFLALENDAAEAAINKQFFRGWSRKPTRGKNNGATSILIYQQRERRSALC